MSDNESTPCAQQNWWKEFTIVCVCVWQLNHWASTPCVSSKELRGKTDAPASRERDRQRKRKSWHCQAVLLKALPAACNHRLDSTPALFSFSLLLHFPQETLLSTSPFCLHSHTNTNLTSTHADRKTTSQTHSSQPECTSRYPTVGLTHILLKP